MHSTIKFSAMCTYLLKLQGALERMINRNQGKAGFKVSASSYNDIIPKIFIHICIWWLYYGRVSSLGYREFGIAVEGDFKPKLIIINESEITC